MKSVVVPVEPPEAMERAFSTAYRQKERDIASPTPTEHPADGGGAFGYAYRAMLAAAPIVPAPAYGVKALEWKVVQGFSLYGDAYRASAGMAGYRIEQQASQKQFRFLVRTLGVSPHDLVGEANSLDEAKAAAQADFERRILSCLSSAPVEEADAKAGEPEGKFDRCGSAVQIGESETLERRARGLHVDWAEGVGYHYFPSYDPTPPAPTIPSEPEAKEEAGAGPVGEAVAQKLFEAFAVPRGNVHGVWADYGEDGKVMFREVNSHFLASIDRPVEEPGEVEKRELARIDRIHERDFNNGYRHGNSVASARAETAEAALAETRERLEKVEAALRQAEGEFSLIDCEGITETRNLADVFDRIKAFASRGAANARAALSTQESSAALAGDGKEVGL